jgi:hypothetical protein
VIRFLSRPLPFAVAVTSAALLLSVYALDLAKQSDGSYRSCLVRLKSADYCRLLVSGR